MNKENQKLFNKTERKGILCWI